MMKELIRNGGFERGNLDFWELILGTANIQSSYKKRGAYAVQLKPSDAGYGIFQTKDKIKVSPFELYRFVSWIKNSTWSEIEAVACFYDSDYAYISGEDIQLLSRSGAFDWTRFEAFFIVPIEASYMNISFVPNGTSDKVGYIDSVSLQNITPDRVAVYPMELANISNWTTTGTFYVASKFSGLWKYADFYLDVSSLSGTSPTLDVNIQAYDPVTGEWTDIVVFDQVTSPGAQMKVLTAGLGWKVRVKYTIGGTISDCDFKVGAIFKR